MVHLGFPIWVAALASIGYVQAQSLSDAVASQDDLSLLGQLLKGAPKQAALLSSLKDVTIFAPNNDAFQALIKAGVVDPNNLDLNLLEAVLRYHFGKGVVKASDVMATPTFLPTYLSSTFTTQDGMMIGANVTGGQVIDVALDGQDVVLTSGLKQTSTVVTPDLKFDNGIIHIVDTVLTVPAAASETALDAGLTALAGALDATGLLPTVDGLKDVTIFAPTNEAFQAVGSAFAGASVKTLKDVLTYHVITGTVGYSTALKDGASLKTVEGADVTITIGDDGSVFVNAARVIEADVLVAGGVVHVIDSVLNPMDASAEPSPSATTAVPQYSGSSVSMVPFTSGVSPSTTVSELASTTSAVAAAPTSGASGTSGGSSSPTPTGGAAALKGGAGLAVAAGVFVAGMI